MRKMPARAAAVIGFGLLTLAACVADGGVAPAPYSVSRAALSAHVDFLADDRLEGRLAGSVGDRIATRYIAGQFAEAGAVPLPGGISDQKVELEGGGTSRNVLAMVPGVLHPDEYVLYIAHHDGQGMGNDLCQRADESDNICNSAVDNASGVAVLIELARRYAEQPAERSIIFLASAAEEGGLWGAYAFTTDPPVPLSSIRAVLGLDTVAARGYTRNVVLLGAGLTDLGSMAEAAAVAEGRRLVRSQEADDFYDRSDHFAFAEAGVPAVMLTGLFAPANGGLAATPYMTARYHSASDEAGPGIDWSGAQADAGLLYRFGRLIANADQAPKWQPTSPYQRP
ncbi:M28 family peptidase [Pacificimonas sp. ICDLI1SI03]